MTMVYEQSRPYSGMYNDHVYQHQQPTQFRDPFQNSNTAFHSTKPETSRPMNLGLPYAPMVTSGPLASGSNYSTSGFNGADLLSLPQDISRNTPYPSQQHFTTSASQNPTYATANSYQAMDYAHSLQQQQAQQQRKLSDHTDHRAAPPSFGELDASRGMLALSHQMTDLTPRDIYDVRAQEHRGSADSGYGFPPTHSTGSSISAASGRESYNMYASSHYGSVDSATDYSSAASDAGYEGLASRTLPRPQQMAGLSGGPPAPQSMMMGQFSSKMSSNTQKKHKCKVCDKRFTRPSSLATHMYSHTGEKPFACPVEGCGRNFSVVSNLRRHKKVHKGDSVSNHSDNED